MRTLLVLLLLVSGCASTGNTEPDPCTSIGGVWYTAPGMHGSECIDKQILQDELNRLFG